MSCGNVSGMSWISPVSARVSPSANGISEEQLRQIRGDESSADAARELGLDLSELQREAMKLAAVGLFRTGQSRGRPLGTPDKLPAVDGPVAKSHTRDQMNRLAAHEGAFFLPETGGGHSVVSWMGSVDGERIGQHITPARNALQSSRDHS